MSNDNQRDDDLPEGLSDEAFMQVIAALTRGGKCSHAKHLKHLLQVIGAHLLQVEGGRIEVDMTVLTEESTRDKGVIMYALKDHPDVVVIELSNEEPGEKAKEPPVFIHATSKGVH